MVKKKCNRVFLNQFHRVLMVCVCVSGFEPMRGDWVLAQYVVSPAECSSQAQAVSPLRYRRMDGVSHSHAGHVRKSGLSKSQE